MSVLEGARGTIGKGLGGLGSESPSRGEEGPWEEESPGKDRRNGPGEVEGEDPGEEERPKAGEVKDSSFW